MIMREVLITAICILLLTGCCRSYEKKSNDTTDIIAVSDRVVPLTICLKYDEPLNGYDVLLQCKQAYCGVQSACFVIIILKQGNRTITEYIPEVINFERLFEEEEWSAILTHDTTIIHNSHEKSCHTFFDCHNIVYFEDIDFDGKDELVVCTSPTKAASSDIMDCETYIAYEVYSDFLYHNDNRYTRRIAEDLCRTQYSVDTQLQTISFIGYLNAYESVKEVYWFKGGRPYRFDYVNSDGEEQNEYRFMIDSIDAFIDSIQLSRYVEQ